MFTHSLQCLCGGGNMNNNEYYKHNEELKSKFGHLKNVAQIRRCNDSKRE